MNSFTYHRPSSLQDAVETLRACGDGKFLGGGQSLIPVMKLDLASPSDLVALKGVEGLRGITREGDAIVIGSMTTHAEVAESEDVRTAIPGLAAMAEGIGDPQVRNQGTLGGSVAHNDPAADYPAALLALGATVLTDRREITADGFFKGLFETALEADEVVTAVRFPVPQASAYAKFPNPASKYALVGVMVARGRGDVRVAVTGGGHGVFRARALEEALAVSFSGEALAGVAVETDAMTSDLGASAEYRTHLVGVMARRAVEACR